MSKTILLTSLKGGVGKTTACAGIAFGLAFYGKRVLCLDLDFGTRGLDIALGAEAFAGTDVSELFGGASLEGAPAKLQKNLYFVPAPALIPTEVYSDGQIHRLLCACKKAFDFVLLDLPAGGGPLFEPLARCPAVDLALVVSTSSPTAIRAAEQTGYELNHFGCKDQKLILNRFDLSSRHSGSISQIIQKTAVPILGVVPEDPLASLCLSSGIPLSALPHTPASQAIWNICARLLGADVPLLKGIVKSRRKTRFL